VPLCHTLTPAGYEVPGVPLDAPHVSALFSQLPSGTNLASSSQPLRTEYVYHFRQLGYTIQHRKVVIIFLITAQMLTAARNRNNCVTDSMKPLKHSDLKVSASGSYQPNHQHDL